MIKATKHDSCGIWTHAACASGTWVHPLRPLGQTVTDNMTLSLCDHLFQTSHCLLPLVWLACLFSCLFCFRVVCFVLFRFVSFCFVLFVCLFVCGLRRRRRRRLLGKVQTAEVLQARQTERETKQATCQQILPATSRSENLKSETKGAIKRWKIPIKNLRWFRNFRTIGMSLPLLSLSPLLFRIWFELI